MARILGLLAVVAVVLIGAAPSAAAHSANGQPIPDAANYLSTITGFTPPVAGVSAQIDPRGEWIEVSNSTRRTLIILGYAREPYLRVTPAGVDANVNAPSWALNHSLFGDLSQLGDTSLKPEWQHIQNDSTASWHDHRIHWMGVQRSPAVAADPAIGHLLGRWTVHMTLGGTPIDLHGTLSWIALPPPAHHGGNALVSYGIGGAVAITAISGGVVWRRRRGRHQRVADAATAESSAVPDLVRS